MYLNKLNQNKEFKEKFEKEYEEISYKELWLAFREKYKTHQVFVPYKRYNGRIIGSVDDVMDKFAKEWKNEK